MIFYDQKQHRKYYARFAIVSMLLLAFAIVIHVFSILNTQNANTFLQGGVPTVFASGNEVVLTFDDGPDPKYTRQIVKILKEQKVPATFFFVGESMIDNPDIVREVYDEGFEIGNHTYTHSQFVHTSRRRLIRELNATNEVLAKITGHNTILYRPPFLQDLNDVHSTIVTNADEVEHEPITWATDVGYVVVDVNIDTLDWDEKSPEEIVERVLTNIDNGSVILLHDGGYWDRSKTLEALPMLISELRKRGYSFISVSALMGLSRKDIMPMAGDNILERIEYSFVAMALRSMDAADTLIRGAIVLNIFKILAILLLFASFSIVILSRKRNRKEPPVSPWMDGVSILIPAYNESANIVATIQSIANNTHPEKEIIVIDDGSTDDTCEKVRELQSTLKENIILIQQENAGKASALNNGLSHATYGVAVAIDGDTIVDRYAIAELAKHFHNSSVGAVAGKVHPILGEKLLTMFQGIEYITSQNIEKTAFSSIEGVSIVPGAIGAWRVQSVREIGGYSDATLVEDQDLSLAMHKNNMRIIYEPKAIAYTEVPTTNRDFIKQRFRWIFGTVQCVWKYKTSLFSPTSFSLGWIILPNSIIFSAILPIVWPMIDTLVVVALIRGEWYGILYAYVPFLLIDITYTSLALLSEKGHWKLILFVPFQRIYYRFAIAFVLLYSIWKAIEGTSALWRNLERTGAAQKLYDRKLCKQTSVYVNPITSLPANLRGRYNFFPRPVGNLARRD
jgi:cellulose synthase/poly-beta-1,6-N-acetylglucosamine synthase-like glycosyltransferase/peptidoglycan/xylan/chitin deacetylase (PgdA/CDA1 family)